MASPLVDRLAPLLELMDAEAVPQARAALDASLIFRVDGSPADLRSLVFEGLHESQQARVLNRIRDCCAPPPADCYGFVLLSDVDDTLLPGHDALQIAGSDRSWHLDGRLYPGVSRTHLELRGGLRDAYGGDYSVLLTARPPALVRSLGNKLKRITGLNNPRMAILPGEGNPADMAKNAVRALFGKYTQLGETKRARAVEYARLFPEYAGRFVFIGDDGQADAEAARDMLAMRGDGASRAVPLFAFVAVKAVKQTDDYLVPTRQRTELVEVSRRQFPSFENPPGATAAADGTRHHRFFYFDDYQDLAEQLAEAGWIRSDQRDNILRAFCRDRMPDLVSCAQACDLQSLREGIATWSESIGEADEADVQAYEHAGAALADVVRATVQLAMPPEDISHIVLQVLDVRTTDGLCWQTGNFDPYSTPPSFVLEDLNAVKAKAPSSAFGLFDSGVQRWEARSDGSIQISRQDLLRDGARFALDCIPARTYSHSRCFVCLHESISAVRDGGSTEAILVGTGSKPCPAEPLGDVTVRVKWLNAPMRASWFLGSRSSTASV